ncbi:putative Late nodulin [Medicago truncatula]|uniref:Nodule Cysteine-Rich (NCR) secreted peptide n=1 Tax=Medicago truncatula TaxID=3880 RepID=A0A072TZN8_MEDTR|nr:Nodule Cysteine-Rich (NCR) secreted peptide [Medicago truncatula]RHN46195.1 putative Late nodulin [Medicago truncatula]
MARIPKFVYVMILFVSLFLIVVDVCGKCNSDAECRERWIMCPLETVVKCVEDECICVH